MTNLSQNRDNLFSGALRLKQGGFGMGHWALGIGQGFANLKVWALGTQSSKLTAFPAILGELHLPALDRLRLLHRFFLGVQTELFLP